MHAKNIGLIVGLGLIATASFARADFRSPAPTSGHVGVYVDRGNQAAYSKLSAQSSSLAFRLQSYNTRVATPTSSPIVYQSRVAEAKQLTAEVSTYNAAAQQMARQSPVPPSTTQPGQLNPQLYGNPITNMRQLNSALGR